MSCHAACDYMGTIVVKTKDEVVVYTWGQRQRRV